MAAKKRQELEAAKVAQQLEDEIRAGGGPGKIPLRDRFGKIRAFALVSPEDEAPVRQHKWHIAQHPDSDSSYAQTNIDSGKDHEDAPLYRRQAGRQGLCLPHQW